MHEVAGCCEFRVVVEVIWCDKAGLYRTIGHVVPGQLEFFTDNEQDREIYSESPLQAVAEAVKLLRDWRPTVAAFRPRASLSRRGTPVPPAPEVM